jgi:hypothetical protein
MRIKSYANDLSHLLEETDAIERKSFLKSFVKKIIVNKGQVTIHYALSMLPDKREQEQIGVLPIVTSGGPSKGTKPRTLPTLRLIANTILVDLWVDR